MRAVLDNVLVRREEDLELAHLQLVLEGATGCGVALVGDDPDRRGPLGELAGPVGERRERDDDEVRATLALDLDEEGNERDSLDSLSETL